MVLIFGLAAAAWAVITSYNRQQAAAPERTESRVRAVRQSTGVILTITNAIRGVLDALAMLTRPAVASPAQAYGRPRFISED